MFNCSPSDKITMMITEKRNNNIGDSLVIEFLNIWSDLKKFNSKESPSKDVEGSHLTGSNEVARVDRLIDPRDVQENLFAGYNGTYMVKRGRKVESPKKEVIPVRRTRPRRRNRTRKVEKKNISKVPERSGEVNDNATVASASEEDYSSASQKNVEIHDCKEEESPEELHQIDDLEATQHTQILLSFLKSVHILPVLEEEDVESLSRSVSTDEDEEETSHKNPSTIPILDDNNNLYNSPVIIDIVTDSSDDTHSEEEIIEEEQMVKVNESRWLDVIEEEEDIMRASLKIRDYKHPLQHDWTFWYFFHQEDRSWSQSLEALVTVSTIEDFWSVINWVESPSSIKTGSDFSMFKRGIMPDWSDKANQGGGRCIVRCQKEEVDTMWTELMMALIGQKFVDPENDDKINGSVVSIRRREDKIAIWVRSLSDRPLAQKSMNAVLGKKGEFSIHKN